MDLKIILMLVWSLQFVESLDFSQFYLPQCCYIPPNPVQASAASDNPAFRHDIQARKIENPKIINLEDNSQLANTSADSTTQSGTTRKRKITARLFRYIIPLDDEESQESNEAMEESSEKMFRQRLGKKKGKNLWKDERAALNERSNETTLLSAAQTEPELLPRNSTSVNMNSTLSSQGGLSMNETLESMLKFKRNINMARENSNETQSEYRQRMSEKVPGNWMINLRRALYQSIDTMINKGANKKLKSDETLQAKSSNHNNPKRSSEEETNRITELWQHLRQANLSLVEPLSRSASTLPQNLYLPQGEGPIASGVVVNTLNGVQLRMASELYFQHTPSTTGCNCHLINNGDILMAYWSVSRIFNEDGNAALQYLIYPLPHNVPNPPRMIAFNEQTFGPASPHDPNSNTVQEYANLQQDQIGHTHITQVAGGGHSQDYEQQMSPYYQEVPLPENIEQPSLPAKYQEPTGNLQLFNPNPQPAIIGDRTGYRGIPIQNQNGYTQEFLQLYKQAVANHLNQKEHQNPPLQQQPQHQRFPPQQQTAYFPSQLTPEVVVNNKQVVPPAHLQLFDGKAPPNSIQDILTPANPFVPGSAILPNQIPGLVGSAGQGVGSQQGITKHGAQQGFNGGISIQQLFPGNGGQQQFHGAVNLGMNIKNHQSPYIESPPKFNMGNFYSFQEPSKGHGPPLADYPIHPDDYEISQHHHGTSYAQHHQGPSHAQHHQGTSHAQHHHGISHAQIPQHHQSISHSQIPQHHNGISHPQHDVYPTHGSHQGNTHYHEEKRYHEQDRPPITHPHRPNLGTYGNSHDDDPIRYHRSQNSPTRHRSEKYSRPNERIFNPDGSYIINF